MNLDRTLVLESEKIRQKLERISYEILEQNFNEKELILAGINTKGVIIAKKLQEILSRIGNVRIKMLNVRVNASNPIEEPVVFSPEGSLNQKVIILIDDVTNTGRTLFYASKPFLDQLPKKIQTAVLVDRKHKMFPVCADFVGLSLSTTLQENIHVEMKAEDIESIYLE